MLKKAFHKHYPEIIWKIRSTESGDRLVMELRNPEKKQASYSCIALESGKATFDQLQLPEAWYCGLEAAAHEHSFFHGYLSQSLPNHRGIFAYQLNNGQLAWEDYNLVFSHAVEEGIIAWNYKAEPRRYQLIDAASGKSLRSYVSAGEMERESHPLPGPNWLFPKACQLSESELKQLPPGTLPDAQRLEMQGFHMLSYTVQEAEYIDQHLQLSNPEGEVIHKDLLTEKAEKRALDTFFVINKQLCYIKNKSEILSYFLDLSY